MDDGEHVIRRLDFSQFHATGDHWPFGRYCRAHYGGGWHHLRLAWHYRSDEYCERVVRRVWRALRMCRWYAHRLQTWHVDGACVTICLCCEMVRPATADETRAAGPPIRFEFPPD